MLNSSMSYGVHKVTPRSWYKLFVTLQKGQEKVKVKTTGFVHNFIIMLTVETMFEGQSQKVEWVMVSTKGWMSYGVHKVVSNCFSTIK